MYKLLIVDDEVIERDALRFIISGKSMKIQEIQEAANGQEAISISALFNPDIVIMDIKMPGLDGIEAAKILKKINKNIKIVFLTAYHEFEMAHEAIKLGAEDFIVKPASKERVIDVLERVIGQIDNFDQMEHQKKDMEEKLNQISKYLECEFLSSVVTGEINEEQAMDYLGFMKIEFKQGFGVAILLESYSDSNLSHLQYNMLKKRFTEKMITSLKKRKIPIFWNQVRNTLYILIYGYPCCNREVYMNMIEEDFEASKEFLGEELNTQVSIGIGKEYTSISELWKSFSQAKIICKNNLMQKRTDLKEHSSLEATLEEKEKALCKSILAGNYEEMVSLVDTILDQIIYNANDMNSIRLKIYEFFILLNKTLSQEAKMNNMKLNSIKPELLYDELKTVDSKGEAKIYIHECLYRIMEEIRLLRSDKTGLILEKIVKYIETHYAENITLEEMADKSGFSTYYLCKIFKKYYNSSFTDYLSYVRIEQAKILLKDPHINIKEITQQIGYVDPNYFTRVFKKLEGMTPTEYRNKWILMGDE